MSDDEEPTVASTTIADTVDATIKYEFTVTESCEYEEALFYVAAKVLREGADIGQVSGCLVNRDSGWDFFEVCDSHSQELCDVASDFCRGDSYGRLARDIAGLSSAEHTRACKGNFLHISHVTLDPAHRGADIGLRCLHALLGWLKAGSAGIPAWTIAVLFPAPDPCADPQPRDEKEPTEEETAQHKVNILKIRAQWARLGFVRKSANSSFSYLLPNRLTLQPRPRDLWVASFGSAVSAGAIAQDAFGRLSGELSAAAEGDRPAVIESQLMRLRAGELDGMLSAKQSVRLVGLAAKPELNGTPGTIVSFVPEKGRYAVQLLKDGAPTGAAISVKPANIEVSNVDDAVAVN